MKVIPYKYLRYVLLGLVAAIVATFWVTKQNGEPVVVRDYADIVNEGVLHAVTEYNSISYFLDGDTTVSGFHYELIRAFAQDKALRLQITPEMSFEQRLSGLLEGKYDVIAYGIPITAELNKSILFTVPIARSKQILVQRKENLDSAKFIRSQLDLAQKTLHVEAGSPSILRIRNLSNEIADTIYIDEVERYGQEQLLAMVAHGDIDYAVANENIARAAIDSFPQLDINTGISFTQLYAWGVRKNATALCDTLNTWLTHYRQTPKFKHLYQKYYHTPPF